MCHELRNPLNGIYGSITLIKASIEKIDDSLASVGQNELHQKSTANLKSYLDQWH
jgi:nitrogen-specific signal transduction histidine kinase